MASMEMICFRDTPTLTLSLRALQKAKSFRTTRNIRDAHKSGWVELFRICSGNDTVLEQTIVELASSTST